MKKRSLVFISLLSGLLMTLAWMNVMTLGFLMLIAFIPLLFVEDYIANNNSDRRFSSTAAFIYSYPAFFLFAFCNTYWISNASMIGYLVPVAEAAFMSVVFQIYSYSKHVANNKQGAYFFLVIYWMAFEYIQFKWDINFPWLNLGNSFASYPQLVQWYSVLGMEGGSLWILLSNILIYFFIIWFCKDKIVFEQFNVGRDIVNITDTANNLRNIFNKNKYLIFAFLIIAVPVIWSLILFYTYKDKNEKNACVLLVQPKLDPYNEQYELEPWEVIARAESIAAPLMDKNVDYLVLPESCIQE